MHAFHPCVCCEFQAPAPAPAVVRLPGPTIVVSELAEMMEVRPAEVLKHLMLDLGIMATITQSIDADTARQVANNFEVEVRVMVQVFRLCNHFE